MKNQYRSRSQRTARRLGSILLASLASSLAPGSMAYARNDWTVTGSMAAPRGEHTATLLANGQVLAAGGMSTGSVPLASAEVYDPASGSWTATGSMTTVRYRHTATLLPSGQVLVAGGSYTATAELY